MKKKILLTVLVLLLITGAVTGTVLGVQAYQKNQLIAYVEYVGNLNWADDYSDLQSDGMVTNDASQMVYLENGQIVKEIYVTEGQEVKAGDPLMAYDITSLELSIEIKKMQLQTNQDQYAAEKAQLKTLKAAKPMTQPPASAESPDADGKEGEWALPSPEKLQGAYQYISDTAVPYNIGEEGAGEIGTAEMPYRYLCTKDAFVFGSVLNTFAENGTCAVFEIREGGDVNGALMASWTLNGSCLSPDYEENSRWSIFTHTMEQPPEEETETETLPEETETGYTAQELAAEIQRKEQELKRLDLERRKAELSLQELEEQKKDGIVYAKVDGTVKTVGDPENPPTDGSAFLEVSGSQGLYIKGTVSELKREEIAVGQTVTASGWETGNQYTGTIASIDNYPSESGGYYGDGNPNVSYYGYTAYIENPQGLQNGEYVELTIEKQEAEESGSSVYIEQCYVREENGRSYVYKDVNGCLKKQYVTTGKLLYGSAVEITSGLTEEDYIAFPYGKTAQEGVRTSQAQ